MDRWISHWDPEDTAFWAATGRRVARRNLIYSIASEHLAFCVWMLWSVIVVAMPQAGFRLSLDQLFWLVALPSLVGATLRLPYSFAVTRFGGRNWTTASTLALLVPAVLLVIAVSDPRTPYWVLLVAAATAGLGGGTFASSMANISYFFPDRMKGLVLGVNAAGGNLGVSTVQFFIPLVIMAGAGVQLTGAGYVWVPLIVLAAACAWRFMDNLANVRSTVTGQLAVLRRLNTWIMSFLYIGTFGSFIGYSAALPLLIAYQFEDDSAVAYAFLGPLVGSLARPLGGWLADRVGGARLTLAVFLGMSAGVAGVLWSLRTGSFPAFLGTFLLLFVLSGAGNGSTYRMIPAIFRAYHAENHGTLRSRTQDARREAAAALGIASAIGAYGGFLIPRGFGIALSRTGEIDAALAGFLGLYAACAVVTWWFYLRRRYLADRIPPLVSADV